MIIIAPKNSFSQFSNRAESCVIRDLQMTYVAIIYLRSRVLWPTNSLHHFEGFFPRTLDTSKTVSYSLQFWSSHSRRLFQVPLPHKIYARGLRNNHKVSRPFYSHRRSLYHPKLLSFFQTAQSYASFDTFKWCPMLLSTCVATLYDPTNSLHHFLWFFFGIL